MDEKVDASAVETVSQKSSDPERAGVAQDDEKITFKTKVAVFVRCFSHVNHDTC